MARQVSDTASAEVFGALDHFRCSLTYKWGSFSRQKEPKSGSLVGSTSKAA
jgi:hypothetical protein